MTYCEDFPACGHTDLDPCPGRSVVSEPWYCDDCGEYHIGGLYCPRGDWNYDDCCESGDADFSTSRQRWECTYCGEPVDGPDEPDPVEDQYLDSYMEDRLSGMFE